MLNWIISSSNIICDMFQFLKIIFCFTQNLEVKWYFLLRHVRKAVLSQSDL
jgi:hypothetical protein